MRKLVLISTTTLLSLTTVSLACESVVPLPDKNRKISVQPDCSFEFAGPVVKESYSDNGFRYKFSSSDSYVGLEAKDQGNLKISQVIISNQGCSRHESAIIADCSSGETTAISGTRSPNYGTEIVIGGFSESFVKYAIGSEGLLKISSDASIPQFEAGARKVGLGVFDPYELQSDWLKKDQFNPFCGCKIFYPDSAGAKS